jgi:LmbE family N-acetylglucosaminyl deacetylase
MNWIYLSPHLDDVALSVGGLLWEQSKSGEKVSIWTICGGDPPPGNLSPFAKTLHTRWETGAYSMSIRRLEDIESCQLLGVDHMHFDIPDCIYRRSPVSDEHLYDSEEALWNPVHTDEETLIAKTTKEIAQRLPQDVQVVCPVTLGNHVDHRLTRKAAERLEVPLLYYADYPYVLESDYHKALENLLATHFSISPQALVAWQKAVAAHQSQISTFWENLNQMQRAILEYCRLMEGIKLFG